jgi:peptide/nickel transport system substrate-binding protein
MHCQRSSDRTIPIESKITLLCSGRTEQNVFRDGPSTMSLLFLPLVFMDEEDRPQPCLLESWEHSEDYTEWIFHLRQDVKWHDGKPVIASDVKFTLELITDPDLMYETKFFEEIIIVDNFTCHLRSKQPFNPFIYNWYGICPEHLLGGLDKSKFFLWEFWKHPVGNGPYRYVRHVPNTMVELEANPDYYREKPKIERVILKFGGNPLTELLSGNVDAVNNLPLLDAIKIAKDSRFVMYHEIIVTTVFSIIWNHQNPLFKKIAVRRAITLAINRRELHQVLNLPENTPIFDAAITPGQFFRGEVPAPVPYDPEQAKRILDDEGWIEAEKDGVREKNGRKFRFSLFVSAAQVATAVYIQDQLRKVGIHMEINTMERSVYASRRKAGKFDAILTGFGPFGSDWGFGGYINPEFKQLLEATMRSLNHDEFDRNVRKIRPIFQKDLPWFFLYPNVVFNVVHKRIRGLKSPYRAYPAKFMEYLWIEEEK